MPTIIYRPGDLHNHPAVKARPASAGKPARKAQPFRRGLLNVGKTYFYSEIEPQLERVKLGSKAVGYTERSVEKFVAEGIAAATAERDAERAGAEVNPL